MERAPVQMIGKLIDLCAKNRWFVIFTFLVAAFGATAALRRTHVDAIPALSDPHQVIIFTEWMGRSPTVIEDQLGAWMRPRRPHCKAQACSAVYAI